MNDTQYIWNNKDNNSNQNNLLSIQGMFQINIYFISL